MFAYLSKKLEMPQGANVRCVAWSGEDNFLACGCENGMLKVLKIEGTQGQGNGAGEKGPGTSRGLLAAPSNIAMNQTLEGHNANIQVIAWNNVHQKLTTSDAKGLIIVWMLYKGTWYEEMVNNRNRSTVRGLGWSHDGSKICIVYEDGGVIVGSADGNRIWGKDIKNIMLTGVTWSPDAKTILFVTATGEIHVYDTEGNYMSKMNLEKWPPRLDSSEATDPIVAVKWKGSKVDAEKPVLAVIWKASRLSLLHGANDENPTVVDTRLTAATGDWSPNGMYIAVGGTPVTGKGSDKGNEPEQVNIYDQHGKFLQIVRVPGSPLSSLSWDYLSLRLAIGAGPHVYFANLRPLYKFAFFGSNVIAYAFVRPDDTHHIAFWDTNKITTQEVPGTILDVKGDDDYFAVLSMSGSESYNVSVLNAVGAPVDSLTVTTMEPFCIAVTETVLVCLAQNAVLLWRYQSATSQSFITTDISSRRRERSFHIDETPNFHSDAGDHPDFSKEPVFQDLLKQKTSDPAVCCDAKPHLLVIGRDSGRIQLYSLPHGVMLNVLDIAMELGIRSQRILLNCDGLQMAMLDISGHLSVCSLSTSSMKSSTIRKYDRKDIWNLLWARDNPNLMCIMEKTRMYVMKNGEVEEPLISSGYLANFRDLEVTMVLMDEIMQNPESPAADLVTKIETRALRDIRSLIEKETPLEDVCQYVEENSHPCLWRILAQAALNKLDLPVAEAAFVRCKDYAGVQLTKRIAGIPNELVRKAEVCTFFEDFQQAEKLYLEGDRKDLAIEMWKLVGEWKKVESLTKQRPSDKTYRDMCLALGDTLCEQQDWDKAMIHYEKVDDPSKLINCYLMMEDYAGLDKLASSLPENSGFLPQIAAAFEAVGLTTEAVKHYLSCGMAEKAVEAAVVLSQWNLAMELAQKHALHNVAPVLLRYTGHLLENGEIMQAVELLRKSDKPFAAGKLLAMLAIRELNNEDGCNLVTVKKIFVMSAMMFTYKTKKFFRDARPRSDKSSVTITSEVEEENPDLSFESHIPAEFRPTPEEFRWMRESPWRGAEAIHFLLLVQRFIHQAQFGNATKAALHLMNFADILGEERVSTLLALAAVNNKCFSICSRAFINLELIDEEYSDIASDLFSDRVPKDARGQKLECSTCGTVNPEYITQCISCDTKFPICTATGRPITDLSEMWTCEVCRHSADVKEIKHRRYCPLCHHDLRLPTETASQRGY